MQIDWPSMARCHTLLVREEVTMPLTVVLNVGKDFRLLEVRSLILRAAGYVVKTAVCAREAVEQFQGGDFDIVILCHSLTSEDIACLTRSIGSSNPRVPIISITDVTGRCGYSLDAELDRDASDLLRGLAELLAKVGNLADKQTAGTGRSETSGENEISGRQTVLCIDDDQDQLDLRRTLLEGAGFLVLTSQDPTNGLKIFSGGVANAVLLDYSMPSMSGSMVAARMREMRRETPLLLLTGCLNIPKEECELFDRLVCKTEPFTVLLSAINEVLVTIRKKEFSNRM
jgi:DNA-binding response OmpR family regulator